MFQAGLGLVCVIITNSAQVIQGRGHGSVLSKALAPIRLRELSQHSQALRHIQEARHRTPLSAGNEGTLSVAVGV